MKTLRALLSFWLVAAAAAVAQQTISLPAFTNDTRAQDVFVISRDINQTAHWLTCVTNGSNTGTISVGIYASYDGITYFLISQGGQIPAFATQVNLQASGYYSRLEVLYSGLAGAGAAITCGYTGSVGPIPLPQNIGLIAPTSQVVTQQPAFGTGVGTKSAATSLGIGGGPSTIFSGYVINPNASAVFVGLAIVNTCTSIASNCQMVIVQVPANSGLALPIPAIGVGEGSNPQWYVYCSTAMGSLVDPASNCWVNVNFKSLVGVAPN